MKYPVKMILMCLVPIITFYGYAFSQNGGITEKYLLDNTWGYSHYTTKGWFEFGNGHTCYDQSHYGGGADGVYQTDGDTVTVTLKDGNHYILTKVKNKKLRYHLVHDYTQVYPDSLVTEDVDERINVIRNWSLRQKEGTLLDAGTDIRLMVMKSCTGIAKTNIKMRDYPGLESNTYSFDCGTDENYKVNYIAKGRTFAILGRTVDTYRVNGIENYWYAIEVELDDYEGYQISPKYAVPKTKYLWVFGEYINIK
ncbi:MAG TPA: hypothetical protein PKK43_09115 [Spirochaetota bacterium]|nr:hypothetical protein [Spirochaetota bacterium]